MSFFNKINDVLCFYISKKSNRRDNKVFVAYIVKVNTIHHGVLHC